MVFWPWPTEINPRSCVEEICASGLGSVAVEGGDPETRADSKTAVMEACCMLGPGPYPLGICS